MRSKTSARREARTVLAELYERGEEVVSVFLEELAGSRRMRDQLGKTVGRAADAKRRVDQNMQTLLSLLNVPSRADYLRLLTKVEALQGSMVNLGMKLDRLLATQQQAPAPRPRPAKQRKQGRPVAAQ